MVSRHILTQKHPWSRLNVTVWVVCTPLYQEVPGMNLAKKQGLIWFSFLDVRLNLWHPFLWRCDSCKQFLISVQLCVTRTWFLRLMDWIQHKTWNIFLSLSFHGTCLMETKKITFESCHLHKTFSEDLNSSVQRNAGRALRNDVAQIWKLTAYTTPWSIWVKYLTSHQSPDVKHNPSCHSNFFR